MKPCHDVDLDALVFGGLSNEEALDASAHLARCEACRGEHARLVAERHLFAARRRALSSDGALGALPGLDDVLARAKLRPPAPPPLGRSVLRALQVPQSWLPGLERLAVVAAVALVTVGVAHERAPVPEGGGGVTTARRAPLGRASASARAGDTCAAGVCGPSVAILGGGGAAPGDLPRSVVPRTTSESPFASPLAEARQSVMSSELECTSVREQSLMPGKLERILSSTSMMCVGDPS